MNHFNSFADLHKAAMVSARAERYAHAAMSADQVRSACNVSFELPSSAVPRIEHALALKEIARQTALGQSRPQAIASAAKLVRSQGFSVDYAVATARDMAELYLGEWL